MAGHAVLPPLVVLAAAFAAFWMTTCAGEDATPLSVQYNKTLRGFELEHTTEGIQRVTPGRSIRLPGKGVGSWKEISLSRPRGHNARYRDVQSSADVFTVNHLCVFIAMTASHFFKRKIELTTIDYFM